MYKRIDPNENVYILQPFRKGSRTTTKIYRKLGKLPDIMQAHGFSRQEALDWIDSQVRLCEREKEQEASPVPVSFDRNRQINPGRAPFVRVAPFFITRILASAGLWKICQIIQEKHPLPFPLGTLAADLVIHRILNPVSTPEDFIKTEEFPETPAFSLKDMDCALCVLGDHATAIQSFLHPSCGELMEKTDLRSRPLLEDHHNPEGPIETKESSSIRPAARSKEHPAHPAYPAYPAMEGELLYSNAREISWKDREADWRKEEREEGQRLVDWMAQLVMCLLEKMLKKKYPMDELLETLREMKLARLPDGGYAPAFRRTGLTDELEEAWNLPLDTQYISPSTYSALFERSQKEQKGFQPAVQHS